MYTLTYDAENHLTQVKRNGNVIGTYVYDGNGNQVKATTNGTTTYYVSPTFEVEQPDILSLSVENTSSGSNAFTYRTFDTTTTYTIQSGDVLEMDVFLDSHNPDFRGGFDAMLSISGVVRDNSGWVDQNGYGIHPGTVLPSTARGQWYHRTFNIGNKAGQTLSNFKIADEGDTPGYYVILLDNIKITNGGIVKQMIYQDGFPLADQQDGSPTSGITFQTTTRSISYYFAGTQRVAQRRAGYTSNNGVQWLLSDQLSSTTIVTDRAGTVISSQQYKAFGEPFNVSGSMPTNYQFTGQRSDNSIGLYWFNSRWYSTSLGRWAQPDPIIPNIYNPLDLDRYSYVNNNPVNRNDPTGHAPCYDNSQGCQDYWKAYEKYAIRTYYNHPVYTEIDYEYISTGPGYLQPGNLQSLGSSAEGSYDSHSNGAQVPEINGSKHAESPQVGALSIPNDLISPFYKEIKTFFNFPPEFTGGIFYRKTTQGNNPRNSVFAVSIENNTNDNLIIGSVDIEIYSAGELYSQTRAYPFQSPSVSAPTIAGPKSSSKWLTFDPVSYYTGGIINQYAIVTITVVDGRGYWGYVTQQIK